jgi:2,3-bisphosphoglycerate-independent phosphoglycerate mutase
MGYPDMPVVTPEVAGGRLASLARAYEFVLFEYWKTDHAGHERSMHESVSLLEKLDGLLVGIVDAGALEECLLVITSDHGNIEDLSCKTHTRNPVPLILAGKGHRVAAARILHHSSSRPDLTSVTPALLDVIAGWK